MPLDRPTHSHDRFEALTLQRQPSLPIWISVDLVIDRLISHPIPSHPVFQIQTEQLRELTLELNARDVCGLNAHFSGPLHNLHTFTGIVQVSNAIYEEYTVNWLY